METLIFKPDKVLLEKARKKRESRWAELDKTEYTREQKLERMKLDLEVFEGMKMVRERAIKCIEMLEK